jgi:O-antigen/teichoic acid export membrane protein
MNLLGELIREGMPLLINSLIWTVMMSVDKFVILTFMDVSDLGIYSTALLGFSTLVIIPRSISQIFYIKMSLKFGESNDQKVLLSFADQFTFLVSVCTSGVALIAYFWLPVIIEKFIPNYSDGIQAAKILIIGVSLYSTTMMYSNVFSVLKLNSKLIWNTIVLCILNILFSTMLVVALGRNINYVALGTAVSYSLYSIFLIISLGKYLDGSIKNMLLISWTPVIVINLISVVFSMVFKSQVFAFGAASLLLLVIVAVIWLIKKELILNIFKSI